MVLTQLSTFMIARRFHDAEKRAITHPEELTEIYDGDLPLHMAVRLSTSLQLIKIFVRQNPVAVTIYSEKDGKLPIDIIKEQGARLRIDFSVVDVLEQAMDLLREIGAPSLSKSPINSTPKKKKKGVAQGLRRLSMKLRRLSTCSEVSNLSKYLELSNSENIKEWERSFTQKLSDFDNPVTVNNEGNQQDKTKNVVMSHGGLRRLSMKLRRFSTCSDKPVLSKIDEPKNLENMDDRDILMKQLTYVDEPLIANNETEDKKNHKKTSVLKEKFAAIQRKVSRRRARQTMKVPSTKFDRMSSMSSILPFSLDLTL